MPRESHKAPKSPTETKQPKPKVAKEPKPKVEKEPKPKRKLSDKQLEALANGRSKLAQLREEKKTTLD